jgi:ankyrin repeat protein
MALAIHHGDADMVDLLLQYKADPNGKVSNRNVPGEMPPLLQAYVAGRKAIVERLLARKDIDVNVGDPVRRTMLHEAAGAGDTKTVKRLLDLGAKVNAIERDYSTPLHWAVGKNNLEAVRLLVERGADVNLRPTGGKTPLQVAAHSSLPMVKYLVGKGASVTTRDRGGSTALHAAAASRATDAADIARFLIKKGAVVDAYDGTDETKDKTPLHTAAWEQNVAVVRVLLEAGADVQSASPSTGHTPLYLACCRNDLAMARLLLIKMAKVNVTCGGETPLHRAVFSSPELVALLLEYGADRNAKNSDGRIPIEIARDPKVVRLLQAR